MMSKPRLLSVLVLLLASAVSFPGACEAAQGGPTVAKAEPATPTPQVRMRWEDFVSGPGGPARLASLEKGIAKMKSLNDSDPNSLDFRRSWTYWANIHGYFGTESRDGTLQEQIEFLKSSGLADFIPFYAGIKDQTPPDEVASNLWATCPHTSATVLAENFFGWHRMYLYYYERVLRWASGDDTLRLPYWNYTDPSQLALPAEFRDISSPLFEPRRDPGMNKGKSILDPGSTDIDDLLPIDFYLLYQFRIEFGAHGYVHCTVGPTCAVAAMGDVPVAANDPVFFHHHSNVDRFWACWQELHETPNDSWLDQEYSFPDETGTIQTSPVRDFLDYAALGYVYDNVSDCSRSPGASLVAAAKPSAGSGKERKTALVQQIESIAINTLTTSVDLDVSQPMLQRTLSDLTQAGTVELVLKNIAAESHPRTLFHVYLAKKGEASSRNHVGTISWFAAFHHHHSEHKGPKKMTLGFDITDELAQLGGENLSQTGLEVVIEATDGRVAVDAEQREAQAKAVRKLFRPEALLQIGSIELRAVPPAEPLAQD